MITSTYQISTNDRELILAWISIEKIVDISNGDPITNADLDSINWIVDNLFNTGTPIEVTRKSIQNLRRSVDKLNRRLEDYEAKLP
jgi:hypothetical protein